MLQCENLNKIERRLLCMSNRRSVCLFVINDFFIALFCVIYFFPNRFAYIASNINNVNAVGYVYLFKMRRFKIFKLSPTYIAAVAIRGLQYTVTLLGFEFKSYILHLLREAHTSANCNNFHCQSLNIL